MRDVWIGSGVAICVAVVLIVILIMICKRRTVQRKMAHNHVSQSHTVTDQNKMVPIIGGMARRRKKKTSRAGRQTDRQAFTSET
ncbi:hypothetical protein ANANG_G00018540, partial [Anguilla anguilla]